MRVAFLGSLLLFALSVLLGCGSDASTELKPECFPTTGTLTYNGKPPVGATIFLSKLPIDKNPQNAVRQVKPAGIVTADGSFAIRSYDEGDGAMAGEYAVTIVWTGEKTGPGPDLFQGQYANPQTPVTKFTVKRGENKIPEIALKGEAIDPAKAVPLTEMP